MSSISSLLNCPSTLVIMSPILCLRDAASGNQRAKLRTLADFERSHNCLSAWGAATSSLKRSTIVRENLRVRRKLVNGGGIETDAGGVESISHTKSVFSPTSCSAWAMATATMPAAEYPAIA